MSYYYYSIIKIPINYFCNTRVHTYFIVSDVNNHRVFEHELPISNKKKVIEKLEFE